MMTKIASYFSSKLQIHRGEGATVIFFGIYSCLTFAIFIILQSLNDAIFLGTFEASLLPYAFMGSALLITLASAAYAPLVAKIPSNRLRPMTLIAFILILVVFAPLGLLKIRALIFTQYLFFWVAAILMGVFTWQYIQSAFDTREIKRFLPFFLATSTVGSMLGGLMTYLISDNFGVLALHILSIGLLGILLVLSFKRTRYEEHTHDNTVSKSMLSSSFGLVKRNKLIFRLTVLTILGVWLAVLIQYQMMSTLKTRFSTDDLAAFLGSLFFVLNGAVLLIQLFVTRFIIQRYGPGGAILIFPGSVIALSLVCILLPTFWPFVGLYFFSQITYFTLFNPGRIQIISYLPVQEMALVKVIQEGVISAASVVIICILLSLIITVLPPAVVAWFIFMIGLVTMFGAAGINGMYTAELSLSFHKHALTLGTCTEQLLHLDGNLLSLLRNRLDSDRKEEVEFALRTIARLQCLALFADVREYLDHPEESIQIAAADTLLGLNRTEAVPLLKIRLSEDNCGPVVTAHLLRGIGEDALPLARKWMDKDVEEAVRVEAAALLYRFGVTEERCQGATLLKVLTSGSDHERIAAAKMLQSIGDIAPQGILLTLLNDNNREVCMAALCAACTVSSRNIVERIVPFLDDKLLHDSAQKALIMSGKIARTFFKDGYDNGNLRLTSQLVNTAVQVFQKDPDCSCVEILHSWLESKSLEIQEFSIRGLVKLANQGFPSDRSRVDLFIMKNLRTAFELTVLLDRQDGLVKKELQFRYNQCIERIFNGLGTRHDPERIFKIQTTVLSGNRHARVNALEYLEITTDDSVVKPILLLLDDNLIEGKYEKAQLLLPMRPIKEISLKAIAEGDKWLAALVDGHTPRGMNGERIDLARSISMFPIFDGLPFELLYYLTEKGTRQTYNAGDTIFKEGDEASSYFIIISGAAEVYSGQVIKGMVGPGVGFGEAGILSGGLRSASVRCRRETEVLVLWKETFEQLVLTNIAFARVVTRNVVGFLRAEMGKEYFSQPFRKGTGHE